MASDSAAPQWHSLPTPALECIFQNVHPNQLARLRLVCRHWNVAICQSPSLMGSFVPRFTGDKTVFRTASHDEQLKMITASLARFREAFVDAANLEAIARGSPLWDQMGQTVRILHVSGSKDEVFDVGHLLEVLRMVPNMRRLVVKVEQANVSGFENDLGADFKLEQLEALELIVDDIRFFGLFSKICSNLKDLKYGHHKGRQCSVIDFMSLIYAHQDSLQKISIDALFLDHEKLLRQISSADRMKLKEFTCSIIDLSRMLNDHLKNLCRVFPAIECLEFEGFCLNSEILVHLGVLMQLRVLHVSIHNDGTASYSEDSVDKDDEPKDDRIKHLIMFLKKMSQLEELSINFGDHYMTSCVYYIPGYPDLDDFSNQNLITLMLKEFTFTEEFTEFICKCSNIRRLSLVDFNVIFMVDVLQTLSHLNSMVYLEFCPERSVEFSDFDNVRELLRMDSHGIKLNSVRELRCNVVSIVTCCPKVRTLELFYDPEYEDDNIRYMLRGLPELSDLTLHLESDQNITAIQNALDDLANYGRQLRNVLVTGFTDKVSRSTRNSVTYGLGKIANVQFKASFQKYSRWSEP